MLQDDQGGMYLLCYHAFLYRKKDDVATTQYIEEFKDIANE